MSNHRQITSDEFATALAKQGIEISAPRVRELFRKGFPRDLDKFAAKYHQTVTQGGGRSDPELRTARLLLVREQTALTKVRREREEIEARTRAGELIEVAKVREELGMACAKAMAVLQQKFETELPPKQDGMPAEKIAAMNRTALDDIRKILSTPGTY